MMVYSFQLAYHVSSLVDHEFAVVKLCLRIPWAVGGIDWKARPEEGWDWVVIEQHDERVIELDGIEVQQCGISG